MFWRCVILFLTVSVAWPLPRGSSKAEVRRLARLPKAEFAPPLVFDRKSGFSVFPDSAAAAADAALLLKDSKALPSDAPKYLETAYRLEANGDFINALKHYAWAVDLFRKRLESDPASAPDLAGLAQALVSIGRGAEAEIHLEKAFVSAPEDPQVLLAAVAVLRERAWQAISGDQRFFTPASFLDVLNDLLRDAPPAARISESRRFLEEASKRMNRAQALEPANPRVAWQRATFLSFSAAFEEFLRQMQAGESRIKEIQKALFNDEAMSALSAAAKLNEDRPAILAATALAGLVARVPASIGREGNLFTQDAWAQLPLGFQQDLLGLAGRLEAMASEGSNNSAAASEQLGCVQLCVLRDFNGARRSFQQAVGRDPKRHRSWELLVLASFLAGDDDELVEICMNRFSSEPTARSSALLAKAYDRTSDSTRAELVALTGLVVHPNDFLLNLSLAGLLLKREDDSGIWRVNELVRKAEKQLGPSSSAQNRLDLALIKGIYLALSDKPEEARAVLKPHLASSSEAQELMRALER